MQREDPMIGKRVDDYVVERLLGRGGMAAVYQARDESLNRTVAIKILPEDALDSEEMIHRFEREARVIARVSHPNIAQVYRIGRVEGCPYYAMEHIDVLSLAQLLVERGKLTPLKALDFLIQTAQGLRAAAEHGIIHRDVKPANLMVTRDGVIKVVDFGLAKAFHDDTYKTAVGQVMGTPRYMSPEQSRGRAVDLRSDIYSLGATFYHLLAGAPPFEAENAVTLMMKHVQEPVRPLEQFNDRAPMHLCNIIYGMMAKEPEERIADYDRLILALNKVYQEQSGSVSLPASAMPMAVEGSGSGNRKKLLIAAAALVLLVVGLVGATMLGSGGEDERAERAEVAGNEAPRSSDPFEERPGVSETVRMLRDINDFQDEMRKETD